MRLKIIITLFILIWVALLVRVFFLAIKSNEHYERLSYANSTKTELIAPVRGEIFDIKGRPIAINELGFKVQLAPHLESRSPKSKLDEEIDFIVEHLPDLDREKMKKNYLKTNSYYNHKFIDVVDFVPYETIMPLYSRLNLNENVHLELSPKRYYPYAKTAAHTLGYVAKSSVEDLVRDPDDELTGYSGKLGIEKQYNSYLRGEAGLREIKVNAKNQTIEEIGFVSPKEDATLTLGIDIELQSYISSLFEGKAGAVVVMDVNGTILSAGSYPEYDLNSFVNGMPQAMWDKLSNSLDKPFTNKVTNGLYPPGSTIKTGLGLIAYTSKEVGSNFSVVCTSNLPVGGRVFRCWKGGGHGFVDLKRAIRESCDDYFYKASIKLGNEKMASELMRYGLGVKTGIDLPSEFVGTVPSREWKRQKYNKAWYIGETINTSIGQGDFLSTPLQLTTFTALMATGKLPKPHFAKFLGEDLVEDELYDVLSSDEKKHLPLIQKAMYEVCNSPSGTAHRYLNTKVKIAGKTGTAQVVGIKQNIKVRDLEHEMEYYTRSHAWFNSYGPYKNPRYAVTVLVEHGGHGGVATGEIVSKIYNKLVDLGYLTADD